MKRKVEYLGKVEYLTEEEVQTEITRFTLSNFEKTNNGYYECFIPCIICHNYNNVCQSCPATSLWGQEKCKGLYRSAGIFDSYKILSINRETVKFKEEDYDTAIVILNTLKNYYSNLPQEE